MIPIGNSNFYPLIKLNLVFHGIFHRAIKGYFVMPMCPTFFCLSLLYSLLHSITHSLIFLPSKSISDFLSLSPTYSIEYNKLLWVKCDALYWIKWYHRQRILIQLIVKRWFMRGQKLPYSFTNICILVSSFSSEGGLAFQEN